GTDRFEPGIKLGLRRITVKRSLEAVLLEAVAGSEAPPFTYDGRAFERFESVTKRMSQAKYEKLLLDRAHAKRRWENGPAVGVKITDLDGQEILRVRDLAVQQNRISPGTGRNKAEILERLGLLVAGAPMEAAQVLFGKPSPGDYPQCLLKLGRFRGSTVTGEIVDNRQEHYNAFAAVREAMSFLERSLPLGARFPAGKVFREDRFPVPMDALREIVLNAVMHRDYSDPGGYVAVAVFDDHIEISSFGTLPSGITLRQLSGSHASKPRNPLIAEAFHRTGAVEVWGRGTNRVIEACRKQGIPEPVFEERQGFLVVSFAFAAAAEGAKGVTPEVTPEVTPQVRAVLKAARTAQVWRVLQMASGIKDREHFRRAYLKPLV
ncbi:MAG: ATP-binding protein, partial [bacterium]